MNLSPSLPIKSIFHAPKPARLRGGSSINIGFALVVTQVRRGTALWKGSNQSHPAPTPFQEKEKTMITYKVTFRNGETFTVGPLAWRNELIEEMLDRTRKSGMVREWKISACEKTEEGRLKNMGTVESIQRSSGYLAMRRAEKEEDRKFKKALAFVLIAGGILAFVAWRILF